MSASTIERPSDYSPNPARREGFADLVRVIDGTHAPAARPWDIGSGQRVDLVTRRPRRRKVPASVSNGTLVVTDDLLGSMLDFSLLLPDTGTGVDFSTRVSRLPSVDAWEANGTATSASGPRAVSLRLEYNGVFSHRCRQPSLWLTIRATVDLPDLSAVVGSRRARQVQIVADLNLNPRGHRLPANAVVCVPA
ncbi:MAG: hypothetical protein QOJ08_421 [Ilumatobacteraceae bacterium]